MALRLRELPRVPAQRRELFGKKVRFLRRQGLVPARVTQRHGDDLFVQMDEKLFREVYREVGRTGVIALALDNQVVPVMVQRAEYHPLHPTVMHVELVRVEPREPVTAEVPIAFTGLSPAEDLRVGIVLRQAETVTVRGLPGQLPRVIEADLSALAEVGDHILARDLPVPDGVELVSDPETVIATVVRPAVEVPEAPPVAAAEREEEKEEEEEKQEE